MKTKYLTEEFNKELKRLHEQGLSVKEIVEQMFNPQSLPRFIRWRIEAMKKQKKQSAEDSATLILTYMDRKRKRTEQPLASISVRLTMKQAQWLRTKPNTSEFLRDLLDKHINAETDTTKKQIIAELHEQMNKLGKRINELCALISATTDKKRQKQYQDEYDEISLQLIELTKRRDKIYYNQSTS